jgi:hypothetical protein
LLVVELYCISAVCSSFEQNNLSITESLGAWPLCLKYFRQLARRKKNLQTFGAGCKSENADKKHLWCDVSTYLLFSIVEKELELKASLCTHLMPCSASKLKSQKVSTSDVEPFERKLSHNPVQIKNL